MNIKAILGKKVKENITNLSELSCGDTFIIPNSDHKKIMQIIRFYKWGTTQRIVACYYGENSEQFTIEENRFPYVVLIDKAGA